MSTLAELTDDIEAELKDTTNATWSTAELEHHVRRALRAYNRVDPQRTAGDLDSVADQREYSLATLTGLMEVTDVWYPYDSTDEQFPPNRPSWYMTRDGYLYIDVQDVSGDADEDLRIFYTLGHTIEALDSGAATTVDGHGEQAVILGASAYAAQQYARSVIGKVTVSGWTPKQLSDWAASRLAEFSAILEETRRRSVIMQDTRTEWGAADRQQGRGGIV